MAWLSDWAKRIEITVDNSNIDSNLTHFPVPIVLGTSVGQASDDVSAVFDELTSDANRKKIAVTKDDGTTQIYVEIETWDDASEAAVLWVAKSDLTLASGSTTTLYLYYDSSKSDNTEDRGHLCIQSDDSDGSTSFSDSSLSNHTVTANGDVHHETDQSKFGASSIHFDGNGDYLSLADSDDWDFGENDFTIDFWVYIASGTICDFVSSNFLGGTSWVVHWGGGKLYFYSGGTKRAEVSHSLTSSWEHIAYVRSGDTLTIYVDGTSIGTASLSGVSVDGSSYLKVGGDSNLAEIYLDEVRIVKGQAIWTSNFTPSTSQYSGGYIGDTGERAAQDVWDSDFEAVYHMAQDPNGDAADAIKDSTDNANHGTPSGSMTTADLVSGFIGKAIEFDGSGDNIQIDIGSDISADGTISIAVKSTGTVNQYDSPIGWNSAGSGAIAIYANSSSNISIHVQDNGSHCSISSIDYSDFDLYALTLSNSEDLKLQRASDESSATDTLGAAFISQTMDIARWADINTRCWPGIVDEVRISSIARSDDWIKADYHALTDNLLTFGAEEDYSGGPITVTSYKIYGTVKINSVAANRPIRVYHRTTGKFTAKVQPVSGEYTIANQGDGTQISGTFISGEYLVSGEMYYATCIDNQGSYEPQTIDRIFPAMYQYTT